MQSVAHFLVLFGNSSLVELATRLRGFCFDGEENTLGLSSLLVGERGSGIESGFFILDNLISSQKAHLSAGK